MVEHLEIKTLSGDTEFKVVFEANRLRLEGRLVTRVTLIPAYALTSMSRIILTHEPKNEA